MANPIKNNQVPPQDPYANSYGKGGPDPYAKNQGTGGPAPDPYGDSGYDPGMGGDDYGMDGGYEDEFVGGDMEGGPAGGAPQSSYTANELRDMVKAVKDQLTPEQYASFMGRINMAAAMSPDKMEGELAKIAGDLNAAVNPASAEGAEGMEGVEGEGDEEAVEREAKKKELEDYLKAVNDNSDIPSDLKDEAKEKIEKWIKGMELGTITMETVDEELEELKSTISEATAFPPNLQKLAEVTGKTPGELEDLFKKYGIDPKNIPNPPNEAVASLLNDPSFSSTLPDLKTKVSEAEKEIVKAAETAKADCATENNNRAAGTSSAAINDAPFKRLLDLKNGTHDVSKGLIEARKNLATEVASILSAMYGTEIKASTDSAKAGCVSFNGDLNVVSDSTTGSIGFSNDTKIDWPPIELVAYGTDNEGNNTFAAPQWVKDAGFPVYSYDGSTVDNSD